MDIQALPVTLITILILSPLAAMQLRLNYLELHGMGLLLRELGLVRDPITTIARLPLQAAEFGDLAPWRNARRSSAIAAGLAALLAVGGLISLSVATIAEHYGAMPRALLLLSTGFLALLLVGVITLFAESRARAHFWRSILEVRAPEASASIRWNKFFAWQKDLASAAGQFRSTRSGPILSKRRKRKIAARLAREASKPNEKPSP